MVASENPAGRPDGIISCVPYSGRTKAMIAASGLPFVGIGMSNDDIAGLDGNSGFVMNDNDGIGQAAAEHLLSLGGFRSFAYVPDTRGRAWSALRGSSFAATLRTAGKDCETYGGDGGDTAALSAFLASLPRPAAVMAAWDGRAADVIHAAHKARLAVPDDIAVLGVDDDELICEHTAPPLSSVKTDAEGMGGAAAQMMISLLSGKANRRARSKTCPVLGVTERRSTSTPAPASAMIDRAMAFITAEATNGIGPEVWLRAAFRPDADGRVGPEEACRTAFSRRRNGLFRAAKFHRGRHDIGVCPAPPFAHRRERHRSPVLDADRLALPHRGRRGGRADARQGSGAGDHGEDTRRPARYERVAHRADLAPLPRSRAGALPLALLQAAQDGRLRAQVVGYRLVTTRNSGVVGGMEPGGSRNSADALPSGSREPSAAMRLTVAPCHPDANLSTKSSLGSPHRFSAITRSSRSLRAAKIHVPGVAGAHTSSDPCESRAKRLASSSCLRSE